MLHFVIVMPSLIMVSVALPYCNAKCPYAESAIMLSVAFCYCYAECNYAECHYTESYIFLL